MSTQNLVFSILFWTILVATTTAMLSVRLQGISIGAFFDYCTMFIAFAAITGLLGVRHSNKMDAEIKRKAALISKLDLDKK